jgi:hypothetical protein
VIPRIAALVGKQQRADEREYPEQAALGAITGAMSNFVSAESPSQAFESLSSTGSFSNGRNAPHLAHLDRLHNVLDPDWTEAARLGIFFVFIVGHGEIDRFKNRGLERTESLMPRTKGMWTSFCARATKFGLGVTQ